MPDQPSVQNRILYKLAIDEMIGLSSTAISETKRKDFTATTSVSLPLPDGNFQHFKIWESSLMEEGLAAKFGEGTFGELGI